MSIDVHNPAPKDLHNIWEQDKQRRKAAAEVDQIYREDWGGLLEAEIEKRFESKEVIKRLGVVADSSFNPLRWACRKIGAIYSKPPTRYTEASPQDPTPLSPYLAQGTLDLTLGQAAPLLIAHRELFIRPMVVTRSNGADGKPRSEIAHDIILPSQASVVASQDPLAIDAIIYAVPTDPTRSKCEYVYWSAEIHGTLTSEWQWKEAPVPNPYGQVPVVPVHAEYPARRFWHGEESGALRRTTLEAGVAMTHLRHLMKMQSFKLLNLPNEPDKSRFVLDPGVPLITPGGTGQVLDWEADLKGQMDVILQQVGVVLNMLGIRPEAVRGQVDASSGYALELKLHDLQNAWEELRVLWQVWERLLWDVSRKVWEVDGDGAKLPDSPIVVEYAEIGPGRDPTEQADLMLKYKQLGMSDQNIWRELGKDDDWIASNTMEKLENQSTFMPLGGAFGGTIGGEPS